MNNDVLMERFFETLIAGDRTAARQVITEGVRSGLGPAELIADLYWPTYQHIDKLYRQDMLTKLAHHMSTRLLRVLVDRTAAMLPQDNNTGRTVLAFCGESESDELGAQMAIDLLDGSGFQVRFAGGGVANDEILAHVNEEKPDVLLMFASAPADLPNMRQLIDTLREIGACPDIQIAVGAGVFARAEGLAEEIGADIWAHDPLEMVDLLINQPQQRAAEDQRTVGRNRRKRAAA